MKRRNKQFVQNITVQEKKPLMQEVYDWFITQEDGATFGETYTKFNTYSTRHVREKIKNLKEMKLLTTKPCRCHWATIYYGVKK